MTLPIEKDWEFVRGDDFELRLVFRDANGAPISLSGSTFTGHVRVYPDAPGTLATFTFNMAQAANGIVDARVVAASTALFGGAVDYDIQEVTSAGRKKTRMIGKLLPRKDSTRP
jgi:hypothetical protein